MIKNVPERSGKISRMFGNFFSNVREFFSNVREIKIERFKIKNRTFNFQKTNVRFFAIAAMAFFYSIGICKTSY